MDEREQMIFKGKYTLLVVLLNVIIFSAAVAIAVWLIVGDEHWFRVPVVVLATVIFAGSVLLFIPRYKATKSWLQVHGSTKEERIAQAKMEQEAYRAQIRAELEAEMREDEQKNQNGGL